MQLTMRSLLASALFLLGALTVHAAEESGIIKGADEFEFIYRVKLPEITDTARIWIPLAKTDSFQTVSMQKLNIPMKWEKVQDRDYGNDICVVNAQSQDSGKTISFKLFLLLSLPDLIYLEGKANVLGERVGIVGDDPMFFAMLGTIAANLAVTTGARGGVYIAGGIVPRLAEQLGKSEFRARFEAKGRYRDYLAAIPTYLITAQLPAFRGLKHLLGYR